MSSKMLGRFNKATGGEKRRVDILESSNDNKNAGEVVIREASNRVAVCHMPVKDAMTMGQIEKWYVCPKSHTRDDI